ncbi:MAG TPA: GtrA family protein [Kofleriaceae bacterium]
MTTGTRHHLRGRPVALAAALLAKRAFRFAVVGGINTGLDFLAFNLLLWTPLGARYPFLAAALACMAATVNSFLLNRSWTFEFRERKRGLFIQFIAVNVVGVLIHAAVTYVAARLVTGVALNLAKLVAVALGCVWSYLAYSRWTFAATQPRRGDRLDPCGLVADPRLAQQESP